MRAKYSEEVLKVPNITQSDPTAVYELFQDLKITESVTNHLLDPNKEVLNKQFKVKKLSDTDKDTTSSSSSIKAKPPSQPTLEETKDHRPKKIEIVKKPYTKLNTPAAKIAQWIEVPIKELREFCDYEIKYESVKAEDIICSICRYEHYDNMFGMSQATIEKLNYEMVHGAKNIDVVMFSRCKGHFYHKDCAEQLVKNKKSLRCAVCGAIYGVLEGDMPNGTMKVRTINNVHCAGYEKYGTIEIAYYIPNGVRDGISYYGASRIAYLPDNEEGRGVLALLRKAFDRKLTFIVGTSVTTGQTNCVVWSGIHHKTCTHGGSTSYGYPDPTYFNRVREELAARGVLPDG